MDLPACTLDSPTNDAPTNDAPRNDAPRNDAWSSVRSSAPPGERRDRISPSGPARAPDEQRLIRIGLLLPLSGSSGLHGPSGRSCAQLAAEEINALGGMLGRRIQVVVADGGMSFAASAREGERLIEEDGVAALIGTHPSGVREILGPRVGRRLPYIYTPIFEGDAYEPGVFYLGETAYQQLAPVLPWMKAHLGARRWYLIGNDYRWPRDAHRMACRLLAEQRAEIAGETMVPLETENFDAVVAEIRALQPDALIVTLIGSDAVIFHRAFARAGLDARIWRLGLLTEENTLLGIGAESSRRLLTSAAYFASLPYPENEEFVDRYRSRFGPHAPVLNSIGQSCYEGLMFLHRIVSAAGSLEVGKLCRVADGLEMTGPRGRMRMVGRHFVKDMHLAEADGVEFAIRQSFPQVAPNKGNSK